MAVGEKKVGSLRKSRDWAGKARLARRAKSRQLGRKKKGSRPVSWRKAGLILLVVVCLVGFAVAYMIRGGASQDKIRSWLYNWGRKKTSQEHQDKNVSPGRSQPGEPILYGDDYQPPVPPSSTRPGITNHPAKHKTRSRQSRSRAPLVRQPRPRKTEWVAITLRQAQHAMQSYFHGKCSTIYAGKQGYTFRIQNGKKRTPFKVIPQQVHVLPKALRGEFHRNLRGDILFITVHNPEAPEFSATYVGAVLFKTKHNRPDKAIVSVALEAPSGRISKVKPLDVNNDGYFETLLEVESLGPGGYLFRDTALLSWRKNRVVTLWNGRTLEDAPGEPSETAFMREISVQDIDQDGKVELVVSEKQLKYKILPNLERKLIAEHKISTKTYSLQKGRYKLVSKL